MFSRGELIDVIAKALGGALDDESNETPEDMALVIVGELLSRYNISPIGEEKEG